MTNQAMKAALEPEARRAGGGKAALQKVATEVPAIPQRRRFPRDYKLTVLKELDRCGDPGERGLILRREGLYSTHISQWKKWRRDMGSKTKKTSNLSVLRNENARLKRETIRLQARLEKADLLLEIQKKMAEFAENWEKENSEKSPS